MSTNFAFHFDGVDLAELATYSPEKITPDVLVDLMAELNAWRNCVDWRVAETPEEMTDYVESLEEAAGQCNNEEHSNFDDYKEFFDDCVNALNAHWPCAEPWDNNLRSAICDAITAGDIETVDGE